MTMLSRAILSLSWGPGLVFIAFMTAGPLGATSVALAADGATPAAPKASSSTTASKGAAKSTASATSKNAGNSCGCYKDANGSCMCGRHAHCGCPGECEPRGCAEKHDRDIEREIKAEMRRAQEMDRKQQTASRSKTSGDDQASPPEPTPKTEARKSKPKRQGH